MSHGKLAGLLCPTAAATLALTLLGPGCSNSNGPTDTNPVLAAVSLNSSTAVGGSSVQGTVTLSRAATAPSVVVLSSANPTLVVVPPSVTVATGSTSATFTATTGTVAVSTPVIITGSFAGNQTTTLTVTTGLTAAFTVIAPPPLGNNACKLNVGGGSLNCAFNATGSSGPITSYTWTTTIGPNVFNQPLTTISIATPSTNGCNLFTGQTLGGANTILQMIVRLTVRDAAGNTAVATNNNISVTPLAGACGF